MQVRNFCRMNFSNRVATIKGLRCRARPPANQLIALQVVSTYHFSRVLWVQRVLLTLFIVVISGKFNHVDVRQHMIRIPRAAFGYGFLRTD